MPPQNEKNKLNKIVFFMALLVLVLLLALSYRYKDLLSIETNVIVAIDKNCDLRLGQCSSNLPNKGKVSFSITPSDIPLLKPLDLTVEIENFEVMYVDVDFVGIGMDMGFNRYRLKEGQSINSKFFVGKGTLPICTQSKMDWEARILLHTNKSTITVPFRFFTLK